MNWQFFWLVLLSGPSQPRYRSVAKISESIFKGLTAAGTAPDSTIQKVTPDSLFIPIEKNDMETSSSQK